MRRRPESDRSIVGTVSRNLTVNGGSTGTMLVDDTSKLCRRHVIFKNSRGSP